MSSNLDRAKQYLSALENGVDEETLAQFFAPGVVQEEFPNRLTVNGAKRNLTDLLRGNEQGKRVMSKQVYDVQNALVSGNTVILEVVWVGTLAIPIGSLPAGGQMKAYFAVFLEFAEGKIVAQRNYDCFEPW